MKAILFLCLAATSALGAILEWDRNPETNVLGYRVYTGTNSRAYTFTLDVSNSISCELTNLPLKSGTNFFAVTAYDEAFLESDFSDEVFWVNKPSKPKGVRIPDVVASVEGAPTASGPWTEEAEFARISIPTSGNRFYRSKLSIGSDSNVVLVSSAPMSTSTKLLPFDGSKVGKRPVP